VPNGVQTVPFTLVLALDVAQLFSQFQGNFGPQFASAIAAVVNALAEVVVCQGVADLNDGVRSGDSTTSSSASTLSFSLQSVGPYSANTLGSSLTNAMQNQSSSFYTSPFLSSIVAVTPCGNQVLAVSACSGSSSSSGLSGGAIAGIVVGVIIAVLLLCLALFCIMTRSGKAASSEAAPSAAPSSSRQGYTQEGSEFQAPVEDSQSRQVEMVSYAKDDESKVAQAEVETGGEHDTTEDVTTDEGEAAMI